MENNTNDIQQALIEIQLLHYKTLIKKNLWETAIISQEDAAYLLEISKETLRERGKQFKQYRQGNKLYYKTEQIKEALEQCNNFHPTMNNSNDKLFNNYF